MAITTLFIAFSPSLSFATAENFDNFLEPSSATNIDPESSRIVEFIGNVAFVLERITQENAQQWINFSSEQSEKLRAKIREKENEYLREAEYFELKERATKIAAEKYNLTKDYMMRGIFTSDTPKEIKEAYATLQDEEYRNYDKTIEIEAFRKKINSEISGITDATGSFARAIERLHTPSEETIEPTQLWIAYATHQPNIQHRQVAVDFSKIEMCMTVRTSISLPLTTNYGIFRTNYPDDSTGLEMPTIKNLSMILHGFSGKILKSMFPEKEVMFTRPLGHMKSIMKKNLLAEAFVDTNFMALSRGYSTVENYTLLDGSIITIHPQSTYLLHLEGGGSDGVSIRLDALANYWEMRKGES